MLLTVMTLCLSPPSPTGSLKVMEVLLQHGANPLHRDMFRRTALSVSGGTGVHMTEIGKLNTHSSPTTHPSCPTDRYRAQLRGQYYHAIAIQRWTHPLREG